jgi:hypothetical protein
MALFLYCIFTLPCKKLDYLRKNKAFAGFAIRQFVVDGYHRPEDLHAKK